MKINPTNGYQQHSFRGITLETVRRANKMCIMQGKEARQLGMDFKDYIDMQNAMGKFCVDLGNNKKFNCYALAREILSDKEKLKEAFGRAWKNSYK